MWAFYNVLYTEDFVISYFKNTVGIIEDSLKSINENDFKLLVEHSNSVLNLGKIVVTGLAKMYPYARSLLVL